MVEQDKGAALITYNGSTVLNTDAYHVQFTFGILKYIFKVSLHDHVSIIKLITAHKVDLAFKYAKALGKLLPQPVHHVVDFEEGIKIGDSNNG